jgi:predicted nucleotidyltransferase component of viral defense system
MITEKSFTEEWLKTSLQKIGVASDKIDKNKLAFAEKMNHAILLAELLTMNGLDFIFKGGTSLILLLDEPQRFSIDLDIITKVPAYEIEEVLRKTCQNTKFTHFEIDREKKGEYLKYIIFYFSMHNLPIVKMITSYY